MAHQLHFKGGVLQPEPGQTVSFLLFLVNGNKEVSLTEARKYGLALQGRGPLHSASRQSNEWTTECPVVKVFLHEKSPFGLPRSMHSFYLALGGGMDKQEVTVQPLNAQARLLGYTFRAEARFLKRSEVLAILDPTSIGYKIAASQPTPPVDLLRRMITITRPEPPKEVVAAQHGAARRLRFTKE